LHVRRGVARLLFGASTNRNELIPCGRFHLLLGTRDHVGLGLQRRVDLRRRRFLELLHRAVRVLVQDLSLLPGLIDLLLDLAALRLQRLVELRSLLHHILGHARAGHGQLLFEIDHLGLGLLQAGLEVPCDIAGIVLRLSQVARLGFDLRTLLARETQPEADDQACDSRMNSHGYLPHCLVQAFRSAFQEPRQRSRRDAPRLPRAVDGTEGQSTPARCRKSRPACLGALGPSPLETGAWREASWHRACTALLGGPPPL
jgi:hypothetical protein